MASLKEGVSPGDESADLESYGYKQELGRVLGFFSNFGVAFSYLSPVQVPARRPASAPQRT